MFHFGKTEQHLFGILFSILIDSSREMLGRRTGWMVSVPSCKTDMNSLPTKGSSARLSTNNPPDATITFTRFCIAQPRTGLNTLFTADRIPCISLSPRVREKGGEYGNDKDRYNEGTCEGDGDGHGEGTEHFPLHVGKSKKGKEDCRDNKNSEKHRPQHFFRRLGDDMDKRFTFPLREVPVNIFYYNYGTVENYANMVNSSKTPEGHKIGTHVELMHNDKRKEDREGRDRVTTIDRAPDITKKDEQNEDNEE